jgi:integrase
VALRVTLADGTKKDLQGRTREEVLEKLETLRLAEQQGELVTSGKFPYARWLDQWLEDHVKVRNAITTYERYRGLITHHVAKELGHLAIGEIRGPHIQRFYRKLLEHGYKPATLTVVHAIVHGSMRDPKAMGLIGRNYASDVRLPERNRDATERAFSAQELLLLDQAIAGHRHEWLWRFMLETGIRIGEAAALRWDHVEFEGRRIHIRASYRRALSGPIISAPKTKRGRRTIPLNDAALTALRAQWQHIHEMERRAVVWTKNDLVFPNRLGRPVRQDKTLQEFKQIQLSAGIARPRRLHDLRHTFATLLYARDVNPRAVQELLGHSRIEMTMDLYTGSVTDVLVDAVQRLDKGRATDRSG